MAEKSLRIRILDRLRVYPFDARGPDAKAMALELGRGKDPVTVTRHQVLRELRTMEADGLVKVTGQRGALHWNLTIRGRRL